MSEERAAVIRIERTGMWPVRWLIAVQLPSGVRSLPPDDSAIFFGGAVRKARRYVRRQNIGLAARIEVYW